MIFRRATDIFQHVYFGLDETTRSTLKNPPLDAPVRMGNLRITPFATQVTANRRDPYRIRPEALIQEDGDEVALEQDITNRRFTDSEEEETRIKVLEFLSIFGGFPSDSASSQYGGQGLAALWDSVSQVIADYVQRDSAFPVRLGTTPESYARAAFEKVKGEAERSFLAYDEHIQAQPFNQLATKLDAPQCKRKLEDCAMLAVQHLERLQVSNSLQGDIVDVAANTILYMISGVVRRDYLRRFSIDDDSESFWVPIFNGVIALRPSMSVGYRRILRDLFRYVRERPDFDETHDVFSSFDQISDLRN